MNTREPLATPARDCTSKPFKDKNGDASDERPTPVARGRARLPCSRSPISLVFALWLRPGGFTPTGLPVAAAIAPAVVGISSRFPVKESAHAQSATRRNDLLHSPIARERAGQKFYMRTRGGNTWVELPTPDVVKALADETFVLVQEMNHQRLGGLIDVELRQRKAGPRPA